MMEHLSLKWNNHTATFFHALRNLRSQETFTDATLACQGKFFSVHKLVLATCSEYFAEVFERTTCKAPVVIINGIDVEHLQYILDYMYLGEVDVPQVELSNLINAAKGLQIKGLASSDEDPSTALNKRPVESESKPPSKRLRSTSPSSESKEPIQQKSQPKSLLPVDIIKLEEDEPALSDFPYEEEMETNPLDIETFEEKIDFQANYSPAPSCSRISDVPPPDLDNFTDFPSDGNVSKNEQPLDSTQAGSSGERNAHSSRQFVPRDVSVFACSYCPKKFQHRSRLARHMTVHTGEKHFHCTRCNKSYKRQDHLKAHMISHL